MTEIRLQKKKQNCANPEVIKRCTSIGQLSSSLDFPCALIPRDLKTALQNDLKITNKDTQKTRNYIQFLTNLDQIKSIEQENYLFLFKILLYVEDFTQSMEMKKYNLTKCKMKQNPNIKTVFNICVPYLNIDDPFIKMDDGVYIKENIEGNSSSKVQCRAKIIKISDRSISIDAPKKFIKTYAEDKTYNISFIYSNWTMRCYHYVLDLVTRYDLVSLMYPSIKNNLIKSNLDLCWFNKSIGINPEQKEAVINILNMTAYPAPYILLGPPGTGKTATLVELICQIWKQGNSKCVLVCGSSNAATDEIAIRLLKYINSNEMHRMYSRSKKWSDVPSAIQSFANFVEDETIFLSKDILLLKRIVLVTLTTCARLLKAKFRENHFSYIIIDEASQAIEPEVIIPFMLACTKHETNKGSLQAQFVIAGDHCQLGPFIYSNMAQPLLGKSMLERLMDLPLYKREEDKKYNSCYITKLIRNYRSHKCILHVPNKEFYDNELVACGGSVTTAAIGWSHLPNKEFPLIFHAAVGKEEREEFSFSIYNVKEILITMKYLKLLIGKKLGAIKVKQENIAIITPYKLQQIKIKRELQNKGWNNIEVGTIELFQGREKEIIILNTVRSHIYKTGEKKHIGFLSNEKRFNVAITRAKSLLIIIGNPRVLNVDKHWTLLMEYCKGNKAYIGDTCSFK